MLDCEFLNLAWQDCHAGFGKLESRMAELPCDFAIYEISHGRIAMPDCEFLNLASQVQICV